MEGHRSAADDGRVGFAKKFRDDKPRRGTSDVDEGDEGAEDKADKNGGKSDFDGGEKAAKKRI